MKTKILALLMAALFLFSACADDSGTPNSPSSNDNGSSDGSGISGDGNGNGDHTQNADTVKQDPPSFTPSYKIDPDHHFDYGEDGALPYRIHYPENYDESYAYPVVLFLHGAGERGNDNVAQIEGASFSLLFEDMTSPLYGAIIVAPQCPKGKQWVNTPFGGGSYSVDAIAESNELKAALAILESVCEESSVNRDRIYVMGISMGGYGTWDLLMRHGDIFAGAMPICGAADPTRAASLAEMPIYTCHGNLDTSVPFSGSEAMVNALLSAGSECVLYDWIIGKGHNVWEDAFVRTDIFTWLFQQRRHISQ